MKIGLIDVDGYGGKYKVSSGGDVYSMYRYSCIHGVITKVGKPRKLKPSKDRNGYLIVNLYDGNGRCKSQKVHRLVAKAFLENPQNKRCVCHKDNDPGNCCVENLYWGTDKENQEQAWSDGRHTSRKPVKQISVSGEIIATYESQSEASRRTNIPQANIWKCLVGERKTAGGFIWRTLD